MIPTITTTIDEIIEELEKEQREEPTCTYYLHYDKDRVYGFIDDKNAMRQLIYKILNTEKGDHVIYNNFGVELKNLIGQHIAYIIPELQRRIVDALALDNRILSVYDFSFDNKKNKLSVSFKVNSIFGNVDIEGVSYEF